MDKFDRIESVCVPLLESEIDTDAIFPARFLLGIDRQKYREQLFADRRLDGSFNLDKPCYAGAEIIVAGPRFGIGSSREHAVWALADFGIRCIIAPSFGEIFQANCFKNGVLPLLLAGKQYEEVMDAATQAEAMVIDLRSLKLELSNKTSIDFHVAPDKRKALLYGQDHIDLILEDTSAITKFERNKRSEQPWLFLDIDHMKKVMKRKTSEI